MKGAPTPLRRLERAASIISDFDAFELALAASTDVPTAQSFIKDAKRRGHITRLGRAKRGERARYGIRDFSTPRRFTPTTKL